jgi:pilus assembly protein CpaE
VTILCEPDPTWATVLTAVADGDVRPVETLADAGRVLAASPRETLVVLGPGVDLEHALRFASDVRLSGVDARLVLVRESVTPALRARAGESGVASVVAAADRVALAAAFRRARKPRRGAGQVITVLAARDGYGKTTVAIGLAAALPGRVCLLDLDLGFGDLASTLSLTPERSLAQAAGRYRAVTPAMLGTLAMPAWSDVDCVVAASKPGEATRVPTAMVADLLAILRGAYDFVVVDTVERYPAHALVASDRSQHHVLVTTAELPALRRLRFTLDVLDVLPYGRTSRSVVVNRVHPGAQLSTSDIEEVLKSRVAVALPSTPDVPDSVNRGEVLVSTRPHHPFSAAVRGFADSIAQPNTTTTEKRKKHA